MNKIQKKIKPLLNPRLDSTFKAIFTQDSKESRKALKSFLSAMIGEAVTDVTVKQNEPATQFDREKCIRYDINCVLGDGTTAQVEIQGYDKKCEYGKRAEYYAARLASSSSHVGDDWNELPKSYQISVLNFTYDKNNRIPLHHYTMQDGNDGATLAGILNVIFLELTKLPKIKVKDDVSVLPAAIKWGTFLKEADNPVRQDLIDSIVKSEEGIMNAEVVLAALSDDRWRWIEQGRIDGDKRDIADGLRRSKEEGILIGEKRGLKRGMDANKISNARNLLAMKVLSNEQIAQAVELPLEKIEELAHEMETTSSDTE